MLFRSFAPELDCTYTSVAAGGAAGNTAGTGNIADTQEMLDLCGEQNIVSDIELVDASEASAVDVAYERVVNADVRYRFVIDAATI